MSLYISCWSIESRNVYVDKKYKENGRVYIWQQGFVTESILVHEQCEWIHQMAVYLEVWAELMNSAGRVGSIVSLQFLSYYLITNMTCLSQQMLMSQKAWWSWVKISYHGNQHHSNNGQTQGTWNEYTRFMKIKYFDSYQKEYTRLWTHGLKLDKTGINGDIIKKVVLFLVCILCPLREACGPL